MAASYPTSAKSFSTKATTDTVEASHVNDLQDEVTALETALLTGGLAHNVFPSGTRTLGTSSAFWDKVYGTALIVGAETTSGIRLDIESGTLAVREGDDTAYAPLKLSTLTLTGALLTTGSGVHCINDTANTFMTTGLTTNQGSADNEIAAWKSSDVTHGFTTNAEADTFGAVSKHGATTGGVSLSGYSSSEVGLNFTGAYTTSDTGKTTTADGAVRVRATKLNGTTFGDPAADDNLFVVLANGTTRFIFDNEGSAHADVEWTTYDTHDDLALLDTLDRAMHRRNAVTNAFGEALKYNAQALQDAGVVNFYNKKGKRAMVNFTRLAMLHTGALRQIGRWMQQADQRLSLVDRKVAALGA